MHPYVRERLGLNYEMVDKYLVMRLRKYISDASARGGVIGLSGGVDSALTARLLTKATDNFFILVMPSKSTPKKDVEDAMELIREFKGENRYAYFEIDELVDKFSSLAKTEDKRVIGNVKARVRMVALYTFAQRLGYLVVGTGDKSELMLGYFTKYGDGGVDVLPIGDLYKTQVREMAKWEGLPESIYSKPSSPALWEGQTAESELGIRYEDVDSVLYLAFDEMRSEEQILSLTGLPSPVVRRVISLVKASQHKRMPPEIFRLSGRAINSDWRYPRHWS